MGNNEQGHCQEQGGKIVSLLRFQVPKTLLTDSGCEVPYNEAVLDPNILPAVPRPVTGNANHLRKRDEVMVPESAITAPGLRVFLDYPLTRNLRWIVPPPPSKNFTRQDIAQAGAQLLTAVYEKEVKALRRLAHKQQTGGTDAGIGTGNGVGSDKIGPCGIWAIACNPGGKKFDVFIFPV